jgi:xanthine dehydrogenase accessory factor
MARRASTTSVVIPSATLTSPGVDPNRVNRATSESRPSGWIQSGSTTTVLYRPASRATDPVAACYDESRHPVSIEILREAMARVSRGEAAALATVVGTKGSTPQKASARLLVSRDAGTIGTLGGGGVEADAIREVAARLGGGASVLREYALATGTDEWGLACGGTMLVFIEPLAAPALSWLEPVTAAGAGEPFGLVTLLEGAGAGARLLVSERDTRGSLGRPDLDRAAADLGRQALARETAVCETVGGLRVYAEPFGPEPALTIVGAGHLGKALAALAKFLGLRVTVIDDRSEYADRVRFPEADQVIAGPVGAALAGSGVTSRTVIVVAMRNQDLDYEATAAAARTPARYVGLIGSRRKALLIAGRLAAAGVPPERIRAIRSPIGLDLGARTPQEIALSIAGEWLMLRQAASGAPLRLDDDLLEKAIARGAAGLDPDPSAR